MGSYEDGRVRAGRTGSHPMGSPVTALLAVAALLAAGSAHIQYTVQPGDTLDGIAARHGTSVSVLVGENGIGDPNRIAAGSVVSIPDGSGSAHHVVRPGESLSTIAQRYGVPIGQLADWNAVTDTNRIQAGKRLSVSGPAAQRVASTGGGTHHVAAGDTLWAIARRAGVGIDEIARANGIADPNRIIAGATLTIPGGWHCPVRGPVSFVDDYGITKQSGRFHDGVDMFAARGTPVVAPVAGRVEHVTGTRAGLQFRLHGVDGHVYIGTHLDSLAASGPVQAGEVLGAVGSTGNALGTSPHLHFEIHIDGERITNPYPSLRTACR